MAGTPSFTPGTDQAATGVACLLLVVAAAAVGLALLWGTLWESSATYDEVAYLRIAARWWRTGDQTQITRMGSPLLFWKLQQVPTLWVLDRLGRRELIDDPVGRQEELLPLVRAGALWIWLVALVLVAGWSRLLYGPCAMALSAWLFALSPNLIAHGGLVTMEMPVMAAITGMLFLFWTFLTGGRRVWLWASAVVGGLAFSCKYTTVLIPPILAVAWWLHQWRQRGSPDVGLDLTQVSDGLHAPDNTPPNPPFARGGKTMVKGLFPPLAKGGPGGCFVTGPCRYAALSETALITSRVALGMSGYVLVLLLANVVVTGCAFMPLSQSRGDHPSITAKLGDRFSPWIARIYETPMPQDWVGFATQTHHQMSGGPSYLMGERRLTGWRHYYLVALAVKVPLTFWLLLASRAAMAARGERDDKSPPRDVLLPLVMLIFLAAAALGSSRNYGLRYLLPVARPGDHLGLPTGRKTEDARDCSKDTGNGPQRRLSFPRSAWECRLRRSASSSCPRGRSACPSSRWGPQSGPGGIPTQSVGTRTRKSPGVVATVSDAHAFHTRLASLGRGYIARGTGHRRGERLSTRTDVFQRAGRWPEGRSIHPVRFQPRLGSRPQRAGSPPAIGAGISRSHALLLRRY